MHHNNDVYFSQNPSGFSGTHSPTSLFSNQVPLDQTSNPNYTPQSFIIPSISTSHHPNSLPSTAQSQHISSFTPNTPYSSASGLIIPPSSSSSTTTNATTPSSAVAPIMFGSPLDISDKDSPSWDPTDIESLRDLLEQGERAKWKYIASELTKERNKRITAHACQKKFKDMFGVAEASSPLGSSLAYVVSPNGWGCLGDNYTPRISQNPRPLTAGSSDHDSEDDEDKSLDNINFKNDTDSLKDATRSTPIMTSNLSAPRSQKSSLVTESPLSDLSQQHHPSYSSKPITPSLNTFQKSVDSTSPYQLQSQQPLSSTSPLQPYIMPGYSQYPDTGVPLSNYQPQTYSASYGYSSYTNYNNGNNSTNNTTGYHYGKIPLSTTPGQHQPSQLTSRQSDLSVSTSQLPNIPLQSTPSGTQTSTSLNSHISPPSSSSILPPPSSATSGAPASSPYFTSEKQQSAVDPEIQSDTHNKTTGLQDTPSSPSNPLPAQGGKIESLINS